MNIQTAEIIDQFNIKAAFSVELPPSSCQKALLFNGSLAGEFRIRLSGSFYDEVLLGEPTGIPGPVKLGLIRGETIPRASFTGIDKMVLHYDNRPVYHVCI